MMILSPITAVVSDAYETNDFIVTSNATIFLIVIAILDLPSVYMLDSGKSQGYGMMVWFKIGSLFTIVGQWGRYMAVVYYPD